MRWDDDLVDALVEIHAADVATPGLVAFARPGSYNERQVRRFAQLWEINKTRELPEVDDVGERLAAALPDPLPSTVVHGDFRLGNTMVGRDEPSAHPRRARLGDGRDRRPARRRGLPARDVQRARRAAEPARHVARDGARGIPVTRETSSSATSARSGRDIEPLAWFEALALWKAAVFCEAIYGRFLRGELGRRGHARGALRAGRAVPRRGRGAALTRDDGRSERSDREAVGQELH